jgi:tRNA threonylcarbamoyladenosine biosynthesis protein TsaE
MIKEKITHSQQETIDFGVEIGKSLSGGEIITLTGNLGAGKTHLAKGIVKGLGVSQDDIVSSPTFVLINEYYGRLEVYHIDAYRLNSEAEFAALGFDDLCHRGSVVMVEWADKVPNVLAGLETVDVTISHIDENSRKISVK